MRNSTYIIFVISYAISLLDFITLSCVQFQLYTYITFVFIFVIYRFRAFILYICSLCIHLHFHYCRNLSSSQCTYLLSSYIFVNEFVISHSIITFDHYIQYLLLLLVRSFIYLYDAYSLIFSIIIHTCLC